MKGGRLARRRLCAGAATALAWPRLARARPAAAGLPRLQALLQRSTQADGYLGAVVLVQGRGRRWPALVAGHRDLARQRPMTADTLFRLYSLSKPVATVALLTLVEQGRLSLDDALGAHLPELAALRVGEARRTPRQAPTVRQLLTHSAGIDPALDTEGLSALAGFVTRAAAQPLAAEPGERFAYDGVNTELACRLAEVVSGQPFDHLLQLRVLQPLQMHDTGFEVPPARRSRIAELSALDDDGRLVAARGVSVDEPGVALRSWPSGAGGLYGSAGDYLRFARMLLGGGTLEGYRLLAARTVDAMMTNQLGSAQGGRLPGQPGMGFGLGGSVLVDPAVARTPGAPGRYGWTGASSTAFFVDRHEGVAAVLMAQHLQREAARDLPRLNPAFQAALQEDLG